MIASAALVTACSGGSADEDASSDTAEVSATSDRCGLDAEKVRSEIAGEFDRATARVLKDIAFGTQERGHDNLWHSRDFKVPALHPKWGGDEMTRCKLMAYKKPNDRPNFAPTLEAGEYALTLLEQGPKDIQEGLCSKADVKPLSRVDQ
jgi:hypothetical protein